MTFTEAVEKILTIQPKVQQASIQTTKSERFAKLLLPERHSSSERVRRYLLGTRGIDASLVDNLIKTGRIYENKIRFDEQGKRYTNAVFVGFDKDRKPRHASIRGIGTGYKKEAPGSYKRYSFSIPSSIGSDRLHLFEGVIDLLSYASLLKEEQDRGNVDHLLSLSGAFVAKDDSGKYNTPPSIEQFMHDYPGIKTVVLHLDNDRAGRAATVALTAALATDYTIIDEPPPSGKDFNDYLLRRLVEKSMPEQERSR